MIKQHLVARFMTQQGSCFTRITCQGIVVAAEAMACKAPVVGSDVGGLAENIKSSGGGICVAPRDVGEWLRAIKSIVDSPGMVRRLGEAGRRHVERHCSAADSARRLREIYTEVLASVRQSDRRSDR